MELLTEKQVSELIVDYENKVKAKIEQIKAELQNRKELKKKLEEAKQREALQLQILERLEESEKMLRKQINLSRKMDDNESLKQLQLIKKYEKMLNDQQNAWKKYKEEYENLSTVKEVRKAEANLLCSTIKYRLVLQKIKDTQRMAQLRQMVKKRQEQLRIIRFAELYIGYVNKQNRYRELWDQNRNLAKQAQQLRLEIQEKQTVKQQKLDVEFNKAPVLMKPQQLPQVDLSRFIIHRNKGNDKLDTMSINSYILEEEYMNNDGQNIQKLNSEQNKAMDVDNEDTMPMDIDTQEIDSQEHELVQSNEPPKRLDFKGALDNEGKTQCTALVGECNNNQMRNHVQSNSSNQSRSQVGEHNRTYDGKTESQESHSNTSGNKNTSRKRMISSKNKCHLPSSERKATGKQRKRVDESKLYKQWKRTKRMLDSLRSPTTHASENHKNSSQEKHLRQQTSKQEIIQQHQYPKEMFQQNNQPQIQQPNQPQKRSSSQETMQQQQQISQYPTPKAYQQHEHRREMYLAKEQRQTPHQQLQPMQVSSQTSEQIDFSRLPSNKPRIISKECVNYDLKTVQTNSKIEPTSRTFTEIPTTRSASTMPKSESTPLGQQVPFAIGPQSSANVTPISAEIEPPSMMSTTMYSTDNNYLPDNISAILGSEITEPGGSFELARRLYDSDLNSEDGDFDYEKMMGNVCSPLNKVSPKVQHASIQPPPNVPKNQNAQESNDRVFTFGQFVKKQTSTTKRLF